MNKKLLYFVRSLFLNFVIFFKFPKIGNLKNVVLQAFKSDNDSQVWSFYGSKTVIDGRMKLLFIILFSVFANSVNGQCVNNLITNGDFSSGSTGWAGATAVTSSVVEINSESTYFSGSAGNNDNTAELDRYASLRKVISVVSGTTYTVSFLYARRLDPITPATVAVDFRITGTGVTPSTFTPYTTSSEIPKVGTFTFTATSNSSIGVEFYNSLAGSSTYGAIIDNIVIIPNTQVAPVAVTNPKGSFKTLTSCLNASVGLDVENVPASGVTYSWSTSTPAEVTFTSATNIKSPTVTCTTTGLKQFTVTATKGGCSSTSTTFINVIALPTVYTVTGGGPYCSGGTGAAVGLNNSTSGVNYQLKRDGSDTGSPVAGTGSAINFGAQVTAGTYTVVATNATTGCTSNMTGSAIVTISTLPTVSITGSSNICLGSTTTLSPTSGGTWSSSNNSIATVTNAGVVTSVAAGSATFTFTSSTAPGCSATTGAVTVSSLSSVFNSSGTYAVPPGVTSVQVECWGGGGSGGGSASFNVKGGSGGAGGAYIKSIVPVSAGSYTVVVGAVRTGTTAAGQQGNASWFGTTSLVYAEGGAGGAAPNGGNVSGANGSNSSTITSGVLVSKLPGSNGSAGSSTIGGAGGNGANTTNPEGLGGAQRTTEFDGNFGISPGGGGGGAFVSDGTDHFGGTGATGRVIVTISTPTATAGGTQTICETGTATVSGASATNGTIAWTHNGAGLLNNTTIITPTYTPSVADAGKTITLTMTVSNGPCITPATATYTVIVNKLSANPTSASASLTTICNGGSTTLTLNGGGGGTAETVKWYTTSCGGTLAGTGNGLSVSPIVTTTYYGRYENGTPCNYNTTCSSVTVTVNQKSSDPSSASASLTTICNGGSSTLTLNGGGGGTGATIKWYSASCGGTSVGTGNGFAVSPTVTTTYYGRYEDGTPCNNTACSSVTVTVNQKSADPSSASASLTTICNGGSSTLTLNGGGGGTGATIKWYSASCGGTSVGTGNGLSVSPTVTTTYYGRYEDGTPCNNSACSSVTITVNQISDDPTSASVGSASICIGGSTTLTLNGGGGGTGETIKWYTTSCGGTPAGTGNGLSVNPTVTTTYYGRYENGTPCNYVSNCATVTVTVTALPTIPTITIKHPTCTVLTGTITVTSPAPGTGFTYSIDGTDYTNIDGIFTVPQNTTYNVTTQNASGCISPARSAIVNASSDRVWNGSIDKDWTNPANWTPNLVPTSTDCVVIPLTAKKPEIAAGTSVAIHSVTVDNAAILTVKSKAILTVAAGITVATGGELIFEDDSSLLQTSTDNTINSGNITYKRITSDVRRYDFTCWSSPIHSTPAFTLHDVSPLTLADKYYSFNPSTGWIISYGGVLPMQQGMGYIVRAPQTYDITTPAPYEASFIGTPNNGTIEITPEANKNILVGNPYPSALNAKAFIDDNHDRGVDVGSLYFWTHNSPPVNSIPGDKKYYYNTADYAVYNLTGSTTGSSTPGNNDTPTGFIAAAASFFIKPNSSTNIVFTNSMRVGAGNDQFYKTAKADNEGKNRLWLNFANTEGAFKQVLIGYLDGATNEKDYNYDGPTISGNAYVDFYSINNTDKLTIQGRALPFDDSDLVPLGYVSKIVGDFTISIDKADGFFDTQAVYLEDKNTGKITDLRAENYTFATEKGTFQDRFVLRYTNKTLGTGDFENIENGLLVAVKDKAIKITSAKEAIKEVTIFDINGKLLYDKKKIGSTELQIANLQAANQVLLVKVILENGFTTTKKIVFQ